MALARTDFSRDFVLRNPVGLNFLDDVRPVHRSIYRIGDSDCQRLCDIYLRHDSLMDTFANRVRAARKEAKLNQKQLAAKAGLSQTTISDIERGRNEGSRDVVALAKALKVSAEWLIGGVGKSPLGDADSQIVTEFETVYKSLTDDGKKWLIGSIHAAKSNFSVSAADKGHKKKQA